MKRQKVGLRGNEFSSRIIENIVEYDIVDSDVSTGLIRQGEIEYEKGLTEREFYELFLRIRGSLNELRGKDGITKLGVEIMIYIMMSPDNWTMTTGGKDGRQSEMAQSLGKTTRGIYSIIHKLRVAEFLVDTEDGEVRPHPELVELQKRVRHAKQKGNFCMSYVMNMIIEQ